MKCLKVEDLIARTASGKETELLYQELEVFLNSGVRSSLQARALCDRVIRACNHNLGASSTDSEHVSQLVQLVQLSLHGYDTSAALTGHSTPLYMEKIVFHIVKKLCSLEVYSLCNKVADLLYCRIKSAQKGEDYFVLVRSCFSVLWNSLCATKDKKILNPQDQLRSQIQALSFLLLDTENATPYISKVPIYIKDAINNFENRSGLLTKDDASYLLQEINLLFNSWWSCGQDSESKQLTGTSSFIVLSEMALVVIKVLCKAGHCDLSSTFVNSIENKYKDLAGCQCTAVVLSKWAVKLYSSQETAENKCQALKECARHLRCLPVDLKDQEAHAVLEACGLVMKAVESGKSQGLSGTVLLALFSFIEEYRKFILKMLQKNSKSQTEESKLRQALFLSIYQVFVFADGSLLTSQLDNSDTLDRVLLYCQATAGQMTTELRNLFNDHLFVNAVIVVSNLACGLLQGRLYEQAFTLVEIICRDLCKNVPESLSVNRLNRPFMLAVQASRRAGKLERAMDWVILWLKTLGDRVTTHMAEPVSLWVKTKTDAAHNSDEDIHLRTLRDGFGPDVPDERVMLCLLGEELRAYKELSGATAQERYNTLCDLLDICHEESPHTHLRALYLREMAQVVCFQDFSDQTDCTAVDFSLEALRLLEEEPETPNNADKLKDDKAHACLWLFICTLEKNLQEAIEKDRKQRELREQTKPVANPIETNDFDYEDKQKTQESVQVYEGLHFNLAAETKLCKPLERALNEWAALLQSEVVPSVRNPKQTCNSIALTAALFRMMGKPLKALEAYQLAIRLSRQLADVHGCASFLCQSSSILLDIGIPELTLSQLQQAETLLPTNLTADGPSSLSIYVILLKAQYYYSTGQVGLGVPFLCQVLKEVNEQRQSKNWYLLRAQALHTCSFYLSLDTTALPQAGRRSIAQHGINSPDTALYESLRLLCSLLFTLVGKGLYGNNSGNSDTRFVDHGDNLMLKWQLISELLKCSINAVAVRSNCGAIKEARLQCLETLKLAIKLQALSRCAELLVMKAELELMLGEREESGFDLDKVQNLLELCTDFSDQVQKSEVKIKPRKGRPAKKSEPPPLPLEDDDDKGILSTRWLPKEPIINDFAGSPPLKAQPCRWLSSLMHKSDCQCHCCSEPCLGRATARWASTQADLVLKLNPNDTKICLKLQWAALARCETVSTKLGEQVAKLFPPTGPTKDLYKPFLTQDIVGRVYLRMAWSQLESGSSTAGGVWKILEAGLAFVDSSPSPDLKAVGAGLLAAKAIVSLFTLADKNGCTPEELFSHAWTWKAPKMELISEDQTGLPSSFIKRPKETIKTQGIPDKTKEPKKVNKIQVKSSTTKTMKPAPMTPVITKTKTSIRDLGSFDFNTVVPTLACTPVQKVKVPASVQKSSKKMFISKQFQVYKEVSPCQVKAQPVPAAPRRTKKSRFKVEFSDESDTETSTQAEPKEATDAPKKRATATRKAPLRNKPASEPPAQKVPARRQAKSKKSTAVAQPSSSEDETMICQPSTTRRGRPRRDVSRDEAHFLEEPDKLRTIEEETKDVLDISIEQLRASDTEDEPASSRDRDIDFEVLRRDICFLERNEFVLKKRGHLRDGPQTHRSHPDTMPDNLSLDDVQSLLRSAWLAFQHFPSPIIHATLCALLALSTGQQDPITTAMLHAQSLGLTSRHRTIRHLASCLKKLRKATSDLSDKMDALTLDELNHSESKISTEKRLSHLEDIFAFSLADASTFPKSHCQEFNEQIEHLPSGVSVCVMSVLGVKPGQTGDSILLSRLEKGSAPVTVLIHTSSQPHPISWLVQEIDSIQVEQKVLSSVSEREKWWEGRRALDARVERLLEEMMALLGCWKGFLLPLPLDPKLTVLARNLQKSLSAKGVTVSKEMLKILLTASSVLSKEDLKQFTLGVCPQWPMECDQLLQKVVSQLSDREETKSHMVLILDKYLQKLPWESMSILRSCSVSRMPSLHSLIGLSVQKETGSKSILKQGVDTKQVYYVVDPDANLGNAQDQFKEGFSRKLNWEGVCGVPPDSGRLEEAVATKDLYIFVGHGAGARFLDGHAVLKRPMRAAALLFGCSSAALAVRGEQEGQGIILNYLIAGCPFVLGNLWDVTDRDIDRFTKSLLESWLSAGTGAPLLDYMSSSRQATRMKHLIGAAPVVYGLPVYLQ